MAAGFGKRLLLSTLLIASLRSMLSCPKGAKYPVIYHERLPCSGSGPPVNKPSIFKSVSTTRNVNKLLETAPETSEKHKKDLEIIEIPTSAKS